MAVSSIKENAMRRALAGGARLARYGFDSRLPLRAFSSPQVKIRCKPLLGMP